MHNQKLLDYIKAELERGLSTQQIKQNLLSKGWQEHVVNENIKYAQGGEITSKEKFSFDIVGTVSLYKKYILLVLVLVLIGGGVAILVSGGDLIPDMLDRVTNERDLDRTEPTETTGLQTFEIEPITCEDVDCLIEASKDCTPARLILQIVDWDFLIKSSSIEYRIINKESRFHKDVVSMEHECVLYTMIGGFGVWYDLEDIQEEYKEGYLVESSLLNTNFYEHFIGREGLCVFNHTENLTYVLEREFEGDFSYSLDCFSGHVECLPDKEIINEFECWGDFHIVIPEEIELPQTEDEYEIWVGDEEVYIYEDEEYLEFEDFEE